MSESINYGQKMHRAMRSLIAEVLSEVSAHGLPGEHHFFITFATTHPDVQMADWLFDRYPDEMTIVIQHWYDNLVVTEDGFTITLNFGDSPEPLVIPFDAVRTFVDPSVEFGLRFETNDDDDGPHEVVEMPDLSEPQEPPKALEGPDAADKTAKKKSEKTKGKDADVVSLDSFRKT